MRCTVPCGCRDSSLFLARAFQPTHVSHPLVVAPSGPRDMKKTLQKMLLSVVAPYTEGGIIPPDEYKSTLKSLHTEVVTRAIASRSPNKVLLTPPPAVADEVKLLPRRLRSILSQLCSG